MAWDREKTLIKECLRQFDEKKMFEFTKKPVQDKISRMTLNSKTSESSEQAREKGNKLYTMKKHDSKVHFDILKLYNESVAFAPLNSEALATAYANKSALLQHIGRYRNSISEIDKAFKITKSLSLRVKLLCRRAKCLTSLGSSDNKKYLEKAKYWLGKFDGDSEVKNSLTELVFKAEKFVAAVSDESLKMYKEDAKLSKKISKAEISCGNSVEITYSEKHGPHLIATQDIEPGEILVVENTFSFLNPGQRYAYCSHCTSLLWEVVPCDSCAIACYCSEKCKIEAWKQYHDVECSIVPMIAVIDEIYNRMVHRPCARLGLRIFFIALKETKTISALNNIMKIIDSSKESFWRSKKNTKFDDYKHVCALPSHISGNTLYGLVEEITIYLIILAKFTPLLKECFNYTNFSLEKLMGNDSILSIGALIVQLAAISDTHTFSAERRPAACDHPLHTPSISGGVGCCTLSIAYGVKTSLTCRSCAPNARRCIIEDNRIILYALQPIKKGAQITEGQPSITNGITKQARQAFYKERTGRDCDCPVCEDDWPVMNCMDLFFKEDPTLSLKGIEVLNEIKVLSDKIELRDKICLEARTIKKFSKVVKEALEHAPLPSKLATLAILHLTLLVEITHGFSKSIIPDKCGDQI